MDFTFEVLHMRPNQQWIFIPKFSRQSFTKKELGGGGRHKNKTKKNPTTEQINKKPSYTAKKFNLAQTSQHVNLVIASESSSCSTFRIIFSVSHLPHQLSDPTVCPCHSRGLFQLDQGGGMNTGLNPC